MQHETRQKSSSRAFQRTQKRWKTPKGSETRIYSSTLFAFPKLRGSGTQRVRRAKKCWKCAFRSLLEFFDVFELVEKPSVSSFVWFDAGNYSEFTTWGQRGENLSHDAGLFCFQLGVLARCMLKQRTRVGVALHDKWKWAISRRARSSAQSYFGLRTAPGVLESGRGFSCTSYNRFWRCSSRKIFCPVDYLPLLLNPKENQKSAKKSAKMCARHFWARDAFGLSHGPLDLEERIERVARGDKT